jgi:hypothetical protein
MICRLPISYLFEDAWLSARQLILRSLGWEWRALDSGFALQCTLHRWEDTVVTDESKSSVRASMQTNFMEVALPKSLREVFDVFERFGLILLQ